MTVFFENEIQLNAQNPWPPSLAAYPEGASDFFFGRPKEAAELFQLIRLAPLTVVYGKSGLGKTSLLQAGVYPLLRAEHYLPVHVRFEFRDVARDPPLQQVMRRLKEEMESKKTEYPEPRNESSLWEYLHRKDFQIWSHDNFPLTPVLVFDQFEEIFSRSGGNAELVRQVCDDLADLIENRIPAEITRPSLDLLSQRYRIVLSFREDFLPEIRTWEQKVPSLLRNYLRLNPMSRDRAIEAVTRAGKEVLDPDVAPCIVDLVGKREHAADTATMPEMAIEPVLLNLCCFRLNSKRAKGAKIDKTLVEHTGQDILDEFYREVLEDPAVHGPPDAARFIEEYLIQGDHFRGDYPRDEALNKQLLTEGQLAALTDKHRLLRIVPHPDKKSVVELIHDRLVPVVQKARDERKIKQHQEEQERLAKLAQDERDRERARSEELETQRDAARSSIKLAKILAAVIVLAIFGIGHLLWDKWEQGKKQVRKDALTAVSMVAARLAEGRQALGAGMEPLEQIMYQGLATYRLSQGDRALSQVRSTSLTSLHSVLEASGRLRKAVTIDGLVPTPALAYSPDGNTLAVGGEDGLIRLLDSETYQETGRLDCGQYTTESVWSLAYNSDGTRLAAGYSTNDYKATGSGVVCVFDVLLHKKLHRFEKSNAGTIYSVAYGGRPGAEFIVSGGSDGMLRLWDLKTDRVLELRPKKDVISVAVAVSLDNHWVASGGDDGIIRLWNRSNPNGQPVELTGHKDIVEQIAFSPKNQNLLISAGDDGFITVWNIKERCIAQKSRRQKARIYGIAVSRDGLIAAAGADGNVRLFQLKNNDRTCSKPAGKRTSATVSRPTEFDVIDEGVLLGHGGIVMGVAFNPRGTRLSSTGQDGSIRIWDSKTPGFSLAQLKLGFDAKQPSPGPGNVTTLAISPDDIFIAAGDEQGAIHLWKSFHRPDFEPITLPADRHWQAHDQAIRSLAFLRIGNQSVLVSGSDDGMVKRWDTASLQTIGPDMADQTDPIRSIALSPDSKTLAAGSSDGTVRLWNVETGTIIRRLEKPSYAQGDYELYTVGFTGDGHYMAVGDSYAGLRILDVDKPEFERILQGHTDPVKSISHGGGRWLLSAGKDGRILEWQKSALEHPTIGGLKKRDEFLWRLGFHDSTPVPLSSIDTSRDGGLILIGGHQGRIELWDGDDHVQISTHFLGHQSRDIQAVAMAPDGSFFVTADERTVLLWPGPHQWADIICSKLGKNMSAEQWRKWVSKDIPYEIQCRGLSLSDERS
ncbi:MAG: WD domain, G-beta repeat [Nitrospira sp. OLB3]|nr:MAG: WD domain, G-beta repeat [Nitrospira sp. OLB3]